jgi:uncharacterized protein (TIGR02145 family)
MRFTFNLNQKEFNMKKAKMLSLTAGLVLVMALTFSCSSDDDGGGGKDNPPPPSDGRGDQSSPSGGGGSSSSAVQCLDISSGTFTDNRDGKEYKYVTICSQTWMAENLNYGTSGKCYDSNTANCAKYGRLYHLSDAKTACPNGWHLPTKEEWDLLANAGSTALKATSGWDNCNGMDEYGFSALPGGRGNGMSDTKYGIYSFEGVGEYGTWWTASEELFYNASGQIIRRGNPLYLRISCGGYGYNSSVSYNWFSVRCLQN